MAIVSGELRHPGDPLTRRQFMQLLGAATGSGLLLPPGVKLLFDFLAGPREDANRRISTFIARLNATYEAGAAGAVTFTSGDSNSVLGEPSVALSGNDLVVAAVDRRLTTSGEQLKVKPLFLATATAAGTITREIPSFPTAIAGADPVATLSADGRTTVFGLGAIDANRRVLTASAYDPNRKPWTHQELILPNEITGRLDKPWAVYDPYRRQNLLIAMEGYPDQPVNNKFHLYRVGKNLVCELITTIGDAQPADLRHARSWPLVLPTPDAARILYFRRVNPGNQAMLDYQISETVYRFSTKNTEPEHPLTVGIGPIQENRWFVGKSLNGLVTPSGIPVFTYANQTGVVIASLGVDAKWHFAYGATGGAYFAHPVAMGDQVLVNFWRDEPAGTQHGYFLANYTKDGFTPSLVSKATGQVTRIPDQAGDYIQALSTNPQKVPIVTLTSAGIQVSTINSL